MPNPGGIATDASGDVFVADTGNNLIEKFDPQAFLLTFLAGTGSAQLQSPRGVAVDATGNVYVADTGNDRVEKFGCALRPTTITTSTSTTTTSSTLP